MAHFVDSSEQVSVPVKLQIRRNNKKRGPYGKVKRPWNNNRTISFAQPYVVHMIHIDKTVLESTEGGPPI